MNKVLSAFVRQLRLSVLLIQVAGQWIMTIPYLTEFLLSSSHFRKHIVNALSTGVLCTRHGSEH